jgi:hypothetical protein
VRFFILCGVVPPRRSRLRLQREVTIAIGFSVALAALSSAQTGATLDPHRRAIALSVDVGAYPDDFTRPANAACGSPPGVGAGVSAIARPRSALFVEGELRASMAEQWFQGCDVALVYTPAPGVYSPSGFQPVSGTPVMPLLRTLVHGGFETPRDLLPLIVRGTVGVGMIWNAHPAPIGALKLGVSSRRPGTRLYADLERDVTRVRETESLFRADSVGALAPIGTASRVTHPVWTTLRIGIEMPLR